MIMRAVKQKVNKDQIISRHFVQMRISSSTRPSANYQPREVEEVSMGLRIRGQNLVRNISKEKPNVTLQTSRLD